MEWRHMVVTFEQNTAPNGYGAAADPGATQGATDRGFRGLT